MKKFAKFWKAANFRLKFGLIVTLIFFIIGFVVYYVPHVNPFTFNTYPNKLGASAEHWLGTTSMGQDGVTENVACTDLRFGNAAVTCI